MDEKKIFAIIENRNDDLIYKKAQIELFFRSHPDEAERAEYLRSAYQDRFTEILADGARLGYRPQKNGLLMWEGAYLSRTSESVFSWKLVAGFTAQLIDKREYYVNTEIKPFVPMESQQLTLFDMPAFDQPEDTPVAPLFSHPKLPQQIMDEALCVGANDMLRANHLSQRYALEELVLRKYPAEIKELNERIAGYEQDSTHLAEHPKPAEGIAPMVLGGVIYTERENAGKAIIEACTHMNGAETVSIGSYRGFSMLLSYDGAANEFRMVLKGKLSHTAVLGADAGGNVTRIDNALEKITEHLANARSQLAHTTEQLENARTEMTAPFPKEAELAEKTRRLNELNVLLNLNEQDRPVMADEPDEGDRIRPKAAERER